MYTFKSPVKVHPDNEGELTLNKMASNNKAPQRCFTSENVEMQKEIEWIRTNICMRKCVTFVSKNGDICHCGYNRDKHVSSKTGDTWNEQHDTETEPTNAFGKVEFEVFGRKTGRYVRVDFKTDMNKIIELITDHWKLQLPNLLISVTGGAKNFQMKPQLKEIFRRGLIKVARSTGAWVTSAGLHAGIMKHVGEAIRDYGFTLSGQDKVVAIGIAPWGCVQNKEKLTNPLGLWPAHYHIKDSSPQGVSPLDPNHSHFILVDNGTQNNFGTEIEFRAKFEKEIASRKISEDADVTIPAVVVMVEGGPGTLETVYSSVREKNPVIIIKGSGRAADILAYAYQNQLDREDIIAELQNKIKEEFGENNAKHLFDLVWNSLGDRSLITVFEMGSKDSAGDIDMAVLKALLKVDRYKIKNLHLTLEWNRFDVAKCEIFTDETQWQTALSDELMLSALLLNRVDFVKFFMEYGISLKNFLKKSFLEKLYQKSKHIDLTAVAHLINDLMDDDNFLYSYSKNETFSVNELFLWAVLMNRREMALLFWKEAVEALPAALVANRLLKAMKQRSEDYDQINKLQEHADLFEERAIGVINECYAANDKMALQLLVKQRDNWGKTSCILIAVNADNKKFISQTACQSLLTKIWMGEMDNSNSRWKLFASIFCPFFILWLITFNKENNWEDQNAPVRRKNQGDSLSWKQKFSAFFAAPVITFITNMVFYMVFLVIFSLLLLVEFKDEPSAMEYILYIWVFTIFCEELRQIYIRTCMKAIRHRDGNRFVKVWAKYSNSIRNKIISYITDIWNVVDVLNIFLFVSGIVTRHYQQTDYARTILCLNLILFYFRVLHIYSVHKELGPKLVMIKEMLKDLLYFVAILFIFMVAYGIASQAILYPSTRYSLQLFKEVFKKPYFQMYGELFLPEIEGEECNGSISNGTTEHSNQSRKCPTHFGTIVVPIMMSIYILLTNVLLLNLVIAMFSNTFQKIQDNTDLHWHFQRFGLISEYDTRPRLPPPLILLSHIRLMFCMVYKRNDSKEEDTAFKKLPTIGEQLMYWEGEMADSYWRNKEKFDNDSMKGKVFITFDRTEQIMMKIEELLHQQQHLISAANLPLAQLLVSNPDAQNFPNKLVEIEEKLDNQVERLAQVENQIKEVKEMSKEMSICSDKEIKTEK